MSALLTGGIHDTSEIPARMVAGSLAVDGTFVFGNGAPFDGSAVFGASKSAWDGHCWVEVAEWIIDISLFRTADSQKGPPALKAFVRKHFGEGRAILIAKSAGLAREGLVYVRQYELTKAQVNSLFLGAMHRSDPEAYEQVAKAKGK
jgi:hypothetical protein